MTQSTADLIVMMVLEKSLIKDVKMGELHQVTFRLSRKFRNRKIYLERHC